MESNPGWFHENRRLKIDDTFTREFTRSAECAVDRVRREPMSSLESPPRLEFLRLGGSTLSRRRMMPEQFAGGILRYFVPCLVRKRQEGQEEEVQPQTLLFSVTPLEDVFGCFWQCLGFGTCVGCKALRKKNSGTTWRLKLDDPHLCCSSADPGR